MKKTIIINIENTFIPNILNTLNEKKYYVIINEIKNKSDYIIKNIDFLKIDDFDFNSHFNILTNFITTYSLLYKEIDDNCVSVIIEYLNVYWNKLSLTKN